MGIYLSLVVRHWDGNGHGTFRQVFVVPVALIPHIDVTFQSTYQVGTSSLPGACHADVLEE